MLKYKHVEAAREARLWIGQIIVPLAGIAIAVPESRAAIKERYLRAKEKAKAFFKRES